MTTPTYYAIIPSSVRYSDIESGAKLLYWEITALTNREWFCYANNSYFCNLYKIDKSTVKRWLVSLKKIEVIQIEEINFKRKIFIVEGAQKWAGGGSKMSHIIIK